jgi:hypothetical protein
MIYKVHAEFIEDKAGEFYSKLTDGTIESQKPDGREIVASMQRARITRPGVIAWYEMCYCSPPLQHERATVYDRYLRNITTTPAGTYGDVEGESFWTYLQSL